MAAKKYIHKVTGAAAVLRTVDGSERYLYRGAIIPEGFDKESIEHSVSIGLVSKVEVVSDDDDAAAKAAADAKAAEEAAKAKAAAAKSSK